MKLSVKLTAVVIALIMFVSITGCGKNENLYEGLSREEAALMCAIAETCPKNDNHSKAEYLTFYIEGWSFDEIPQKILDYLKEYATNGNAQLVQLSFEELIEAGYIVGGEADSYYENSKYVYKEGKGKIFTFTLEGDTESDKIVVIQSQMISDEDSSDIKMNMSFSGGEWHVDSRESSKFNSFFTPDPNNTIEPSK